MGAFITERHPGLAEAGRWQQIGMNDEGEGGSGKKGELRYRRMGHGRVERRGGGGGKDREEKGFHPVRGSQEKNGGVGQFIKGLRTKTSGRGDRDAYLKVLRDRPVGHSRFLTKKGGDMVHRGKVLSWGKNLARCLSEKSRKEDMA